MNEIETELAKRGFQLLLRLATFEGDGWMYALGCDPNVVEGRPRYYFRLLSKKWSVSFLGSDLHEAVAKAVSWSCEVCPGKVERVPLQEMTREWRGHSGMYVEGKAAKIAASIIGAFTELGYPLPEDVRAKIQSDIAATLLSD